MVTHEEVGLYMWQSRKQASGSGKELLGVSMGSRTEMTLGKRGFGTGTLELQTSCAGTYERASSVRFVENPGCTTHVSGLVVFLGNVPLDGRVMFC
jgi:hypothetical protein